MNTCASSASRWRSLTLVGDWNEDVGSVTISQVMDHLTRQHPLLLLDWMSFLSASNAIMSSKGDLFGIRLETSSVALLCGRLLTYVSYDALSTFLHPRFHSPPSRPFSLSLTLLPGNITNQIRGLFAFLSSRPNYQQLSSSWSLSATQIVSLEENWAIGVIVCPAITSFRLSVSNFATESAKRIIRPTLEALQMPNLESFSFSFNNSGIHPSAAGILLPDPGDHGRLSSLSISARLPPPTWRNAILQKWDSMMISVPLDRIPHVSSLCVTTFGRLFFTRHEELEEGRGIELSSSLRELQLRFCDNMDGGDLEQMFSR